MLPFAKPPIRFAQSPQAAGLNLEGPFEDDNAWPSRYDYMLGADIYVAPILDANLSIIIHFPPEPKGWVQMWDSKTVYAGDSSINYSCPISNFPAFHRVSTILPLLITNDIIGRGDEWSADAVTLLINRPAIGTSCSRELREFQSTGLEVAYEFVHGDEQNPAVLTLSASGRSACAKQNMTSSTAGEVLDRNLLWLLEEVAVDASAMVMQELPRDDGSNEVMHMGLQVARSTKDLHRLARRGIAGYYFDEAKRSLFVRPANANLGVRIRVTGVKPLD